MTRRVNRPADLQDFLKHLTRKDGGIFGSEVDAMFFAAALGASLGIREPLGKTLDGMVFELFSNHNDRHALFYLLGMNAENGIEILGDARDNDRVTVFEEHAYAGLKHLKGALSTAGTKSDLDVAIAMLQKAWTVPSSTSSELQEILKSLKV